MTSFSQPEFALNLAHVQPSQKDHPSRRLFVIGVTGTNGKTTVTHLIAKALQDAGKKTALLGTLNSGDPDLTTPRADQIEAAMHNHWAAGGTHFVMEVSSEGIAEGRIEDVNFDCRVLTNLAADHLDFHGTLENYHQTKLAFLNGGICHRVAPSDYESIPIDFSHNLVGAFNVRNVQAAIATLRIAGMKDPQIAQSMKDFTPPRGRLTPLLCGQSFDVFVDYAHTPDALEKVLSALKNSARRKGGKLTVVFGCGGNRDASKRPLMGKIAERLADQIILTDDNPRTEDGDLIIAEIQLGMTTDCAVQTVRCRRSAIQRAIVDASNADIVLVAGKGHEQHQIIGDKALPFDDIAVATEILNARVTGAA